MPSRRVIWGLGILFLGVYLFRHGLVVWPYLFRAAGDFGHYHAAARALLQGESPYAQWLAYPPPITVLLLPFGAMSLDAARVAWFLASHTFLLGAALCLWRPLGADLPAFLALGTVWSLGGAAQESLALGQVSPLLLLLIAWALRQDARRPERAAAALGVAAGIKVWPGLLLLADALPGRRRALAVGAGVAVLIVAVPLLLFRVLLPPPWVPLNRGFWMGTPATLNFSLPALALRLTYDLPDDGEVPLEWQTGTHPRIHLPPWRRAVAVATAGAALAAGLLTVAAALRSRASPGPEGRLHLLAALVALALLASPISWYHYQMLQFPGLALLAAGALRRRAFLRLAGVAALGFGLTRPELRNLLLSQGGAVPALLAGAAVALLGAVLFGALLAGLRREPLPPTAPAPWSSGSARPASPRPCS